MKKATLIGAGAGLAAAGVITLSMIAAGIITYPNRSTNTDQDRIVFSGIINSTTHQIFKVNSDGSRLTNLTSGDNLWHFDPVPSPDGSKVAYETWDNFPNAPNGGRIVQHLVIVNIDGTDRIRLTPSEGIEISSKFSWSPDSAKIAYESSEDIYVVNVDGAHTLRLTHDGSPVGEGRRIGNYGPFWSSNTSIIFASATFNGTEPLNGAFKQIASDGTSLRTLFEYDLSNTGGYLWSNDLKNIAFLKLEDDDMASLKVMDDSGRNEKILIDSSKFYSISDLEWSPDDGRISFVGIERSGSAESSPNGGIYVIDVDDGSFKRLGGSETLSTMPVWSSDGTKIAFMNSIGEEAIVINVIDVESGKKYEIARIEQSIVNQPINWVHS
jgi:Tol biopolymer transport system component